MATRPVVDREQRAVLAAALKEICLISGIETESREYDDAAQLLAHLYKNGWIGNGCGCWDERLRAGGA